MIMNVYSIFDKKAGSYGTPFFTQNDDTAIRAVSRLLRDPNTTVANNPEDFQLVRLAFCDDATGELHNLDNFVVAELVDLMIAMEATAKQLKKRVEDVANA